MTTTTLLTEVNNRGIATITLNRPEKGNACNQTMRDELAQQFSSLGRDSAVRVIVLRGAGKHFSVGADVGGFAEPDKPGASLLEVLVALDDLPKPTVALVHGACVGGGLAFAACCDIVLAAPEAFFAISEVRLGLPPLSLAPIFVRAIGYRSFRRYGLSGERFNGAEALRIGLVHQLCESRDFDRTLAILSDELLLGAPGAIAALKAASKPYSSPSDAAALVMKLAASDDTLHDTPEFVEGLASFREKRKPAWYPKS